MDKIKELLHRVKLSNDFYDTIEEDIKMYNDKKISSKYNAYNLLKNC